MSDGFERESLEEEMDKQILDSWGDSSSSSDPDSGDEHDSTVAKNKHSFGRKVSVHTLLGGGKVADILLWRNKQLSAGILTGVTATWLMYHSMGFHLLSFISHALIIALTVSFVWSKVLAMFNKYGRHIFPTEISDAAVNTHFSNQFSSKFPNFFRSLSEISLPEYVVLDVADILYYEMNKAIKIFRSVAMGKDWTEFLVVATVLWMVAVIGSWFDLLTLLYIVFALLYTLPVLCEKYENHIETAANTVMINLYRHSATIDSKILRKIPGSKCKNQQ